VTHYFPAHGGGVEAVAGQIARGLSARHACEVEWWASDSDAPPSLPGVLVCPVRAWNGMESRFGIPVPLWSPIALARLCARVHAADVVHVHDLLYLGNFTAALAALVLRRPLIVTQHLSIVPYQSIFMRALMSACNRTLVCGLLVRAARVVFIADSAKSYFDALCRWRQPPMLVPNGVDTGVYSPPNKAERAAARRALRLADDAPVALFVGRFVEKKGLALLQDLARAAPDVRFLFAGAGPLDPTGWSLPNVEVCRGRAGPTLRELYWAADTLVLPSVGEGFPLVVQEAMACGLEALVSPDVAAGSVDVRSFLAIEPFGPNVIERWCSRVRRECSAEAPERRSALAAAAAERWSWEATAAEYARLFEDVTAASRVLR
jgi:glycosyltransferase involved in cell wall biosynthesis